MLVRQYCLPDARVGFFQLYKAILFVVRMSSWLYVKRIQRLPGGQIRVLSNNHKYAPMEVDAGTPDQEFQVIGKVVWIGREV